MDHLKKIAQKLPKYDLDAMLITSAAGERYALGFHGEGFLIITPQTAHYSTDGRYIEEAQAKISGISVLQATPQKGHLALAEDFIQAQNLKRVGFESNAVSVDTLNRWQEKLSCQLVPQSNLLGELRASKDSEELFAMKRAQKITDAAFSNILNFIRIGATEQEIAARLVYEMMRLGGEKPSFDPIVAAGANGSKPHAVPGQTVIQSGMFVTMDFGCIWNGYCSDMTRTVAVGSPSDEMRLVYDTVLQAQRAGISAARAGIAGKEIDLAARQVIEQAGYGPYFSHSFGHSLGLEIHESPNASASETTILPAGTVISAEPGIYLPQKFGVRIEDVLILQEGGCENITASPKELLILSGK